MALLLDKVLMAVILTSALDVGYQSRRKCPELARQESCAFDVWMAGVDAEPVVGRSLADTRTRP